MATTGTTSTISACLVMAALACAATFYEGKYHTKLKRRVALKVLPEALTVDRTRLARFQRDRAGNDSSDAARSTRCET